MHQYGEKLIEAHRFLFHTAMINMIRSIAISWKIKLKISNARLEANNQILQTSTKEDKWYCQPFSLIFFQILKRKNSIQMLEEISLII